MANPKHLEILKQGVEAWNDWRIKNKEVRPYLAGADLVGDDLVRANLRKAYLERACLGGADLREANLSEADLNRADLFEAALEGANLRGANLWGANLRHANLGKADLHEADLSEVNLRGTNLVGSNFTGAILRGADLAWANLRDANLEKADLVTANLVENNLKDAIMTHAVFGSTALVGLYFNNVKGIEKIFHQGPSYITTDTIQRAHGKLPEEFLRGCGLSDFEIENAKLYNPDLSSQQINDILYKIYDLRAKQSIQISPLFISYGHKDNNFAETIEAQFNNLGVRYWRDVHHGTAGPLEEQIDLAIRHNPTVLLILSENSIKSDWVEHEVRTARELTKELGRHVLCPVALDESWKSSPWPKRIMEQIKEYNILDFSNWQDQNVFEKQFRKLLDGLDLFYK